MATLTISTTGLGVRPYGGGDVPDCHKVEDIEYRRYVAGDDDRNLAVVKLTPEDAYAIACDLLYQAVDAGVIAGWMVSFPERSDADA